VTGRAREDARDPGLQPERTRLAWRRTTLAFTVVTALGMRTVVAGLGTGGFGADAVRVTGLALAGLLWLGFLLVANRRIRGLAAGTRPGSLASGTALAAVGCTVALALCAVAIVR
jgi:uncharacterized membrane protein YidH (DUF202 family)